MALGTTFFERSIVLLPNSVFNCFSSVRNRALALITADFFISEGGTSKRRLRT
jgi:hypothetical protein